MGTRGFVGFLGGDELKITYNHFDSYPSGVGVEVLRWLRQQVAENARAIKPAVQAMQMVSESVQDPNTQRWDDCHPDDDALARLRAAGLVDENVGGPSDRVTWYQALRNAQGEPWKNLAAGYMIDNREFPLDSLFCEWGYLVVLDGDGAFEVYRGFQHAEHDEGRWGVSGHLRPAGWTPDRGLMTGSTYYPVALAASWPLGALPDDDALLALEKEDD